MESKRLINALVALDLSAGIFLDRLRKLQPTDSDKVLLSIMDYFEFYLIFHFIKMPRGSGGQSCDTATIH